MKRSVISIIIIVSMLFGVGADSVSASGAKVIIDPGHGGHDGGASANGLKEKDLNLTISKEINKYLNDNYIVNTKMTRTTDKYLELHERTDMANSWKADLFLSVHINAGGGTGYEDFIHSSIKTNGKGQTEQMRNEINKEVVKVLNKYDIRDRGKKQANFHVLRETQMSAVLIEILFIDHKEDAKLLKNNTFIKDVSVAVGEGVANALNLKEKNVAPDVKKDIITKNNVIKYKTVEEKDSTLNKGQTKVKQAGKNGNEQVKTEVTTVNGKKQSERELSRVVTVKPVNKIILVGTKDVVETKEETVENVIKYKTVTEEDSEKDWGTKEVTQVGKNGLETIVNQITYTNGKVTGTKELSKVVVDAVNEVIVVGTKDVIKVETEVENNVLEFETEFVNDDKIDKGEQEVKQQGKKGEETVAYEVTYTNDKVTNKVELSRDVVEPVKEIILVGTKDVIVVEKVTEENVIKFETEEVEDPEMDKGKTDVKQPGKNGLETIVYEVITTNGEETSKKELSKDVVAPTTEIILVGTKDVIEVKTETDVKDIKFETEEVEDPTLAEGKTEVKQQGKKGTETTTLEVTYVNGEKTDTKVVSVIGVDPVNEIISIGTKEAVTKVGTEEVDKVIKFKTVEEKDSTLAKGKTKVKQAGVNGTETTTYEITYKDGEEVSREVVDTVVEDPANEIILVGTKDSKSLKVSDVVIETGNDEGTPSNKDTKKDKEQKEDKDSNQAVTANKEVEDNSKDKNEEVVKEAVEGNEIPETATNTMTMILIGFVLMLTGIAGVIVLRKRKTVK